MNEQELRQMESRLRDAQDAKRDLSSLDSAIRDLGKAVAIQLDLSNPKEPAVSYADVMDPETKRPRFRNACCNDLLAPHIPGLQQQIKAWLTKIRDAAEEKWKAV